MVRDAMRAASFSYVSLIDLPVGVIHYQYKGHADFVRGSGSMRCNAAGPRPRTMISIA